MYSFFSLKVILLWFLDLLNMPPMGAHVPRQHNSSLVMTIVQFAVNSTLQTITFVKVLLPESHLQNNGIRIPGVGQYLQVHYHCHSFMCPGIKTYCFADLSNGRDLLPPASSFSCVTHQIMSKISQNKY